MDVHRIDPSLALAFYLPNRASFRDLTKKIAEVTNVVMTGDKLPSASLSTSIYQ